MTLKLEAVRNMTSETTHLAVVPKWHTGVFCGKTYRVPDQALTKTLCGVKITDGVIMHPPGSVKAGPIKCSACKHLGDNRNYVNSMFEGVEDLGESDD